MLAVALVVASCVALVLNHLWMDAVWSNGRPAQKWQPWLRAKPDLERKLSAAWKRAAYIAAQNLVAGEPVFLNVGPRGDLCFGRLVTRAKTGLTKFLETKHKPTSVLITIRRTRGRDNPIASLFSGLNGQSAHDAIQRVEATIDNRVGRAGLQRCSRGNSERGCPRSTLRHVGRANPQRR